MKTKLRAFRINVTVICLLALALCAQAFAQGTAFTYQGRLNDGGSPANGSNDFTFAVFAVTSGGLPVAGPIKVEDVIVSNGLFTATVDFGSGVFTGAVQWLEIGVRPGNSGGDYTNLAPRQLLTPTPYAIHAANAAVAESANTGTWSGLNGVPSGFADGVDNDTTYSAGSGLNLAGTTFSLDPLFGDGRYWTLFGNSATAPGPNFLGTTDNQPLELKVNNTRALRLEPGAGSPNVIGGHSGNVVDGSAYGATIGGGGTATEPNRVSAIFGTVGGGLGNTIQTGAVNATLGGGADNTNTGSYATIPGGFRNVATNHAFAAGRRAKANHQGAFVWADATDADFASTTSNQFLIRASGNVGINTNHPQTALHVAGTVTADRFIATADPPVSVLPVTGMVWIHPGTFIMGSRVGESGRNPDEGPQTAVTLTRGFWMGNHEVTQAEYQSVMGGNPSHFTGDLNRPVETVTWHNATNYGGLLTQTERTAGRISGNWGYRLPTEAEWEYVCRAGPRTTRYGYGDDLGNAAFDNYGWWALNSGGTTHPVEQKLANPWGLMDMHGNVWEWCQDWYGSFPGGSVTDPQGFGPGPNRVVRGGSWFNNPWNCRSAMRGGVDPASVADYRGFRVVLAPIQP